MWKPKYLWKSVSKVNWIAIGMNYSQGGIWSYRSLNRPDVLSMYDEIISNATQFKLFVLLIHFYSSVKKERKRQYFTPDT